MSQTHREALAADEAMVEEASMAWLAQVGWRTVGGADLNPGGLLAQRDDLRDAILKAELEAALTRLNPGESKAMVADALAQALKSPTGDLMENNRAFHRLLVDGAPVSFRDAHGETRTERLRLIAADDVALNQFLAANQYAVRSERIPERGARADIVLFVNGLPLGLIELKSPLEPDPLLRAHTQLRNYEAIAPELLRPNAVQVLSDGLSARVGPLTQGLDRFAPWRPEPGEVADGATELEGVIRTLCAPYRFVEHVLGLVAFETDGGRIASKKIAACHQARAVRAARETAVRAAGQGGDRRGGVVWHTHAPLRVLACLFAEITIERGHPAGEA